MRSRLAILRRVQGALTLWVSAYLAFHAWAQWASLGGRNVYTHRALSVSHGTVPLVVNVVLVLVPLAALAASSVLLALRGADDPLVFGSLAFRRLHAGLAVLASAFVVFHLWHAWIPGVGLGEAPSSYEILRDDLGKLPFMLAYLVGLVSTFMLVAYAVPLALVRLESVRTDGAARTARYVFAALAIVVAAAFFNVMSHFARGRALFVPDPTESGQTAPLVEPTPSASPSLASPIAPGPSARPLAPGSRRPPALVPGMPANTGNSDAPPPEIPRN